MTVDHALATIARALDTGLARALVTFEASLVAAGELSDEAIEAVLAAERRHLSAWRRATLRDLRAWVTPVDEPCAMTDVQSRCCN